MTDDDPNRSDDTGPSAADGRLRGPEGVRTREELGAALTERRESAGLSVREVAEQADALLGTVAGWFAGQHAPTKASREPFERVLAVCGVAPGELADWWTAVDNLSRRGARTRKGRPESPYLGFTTFGATDKARYFGRSTEIEMVVRQVVEIHRTWRDSLTPSGVGSAVPPAFAVLGRSGVGKSSLVQVALGGTAGEPGPLREWKYAHMVPGHDPVGAMTAALSELDAQTDRTGPSILVIDQYEELITLHSYDEAIVAGAVWIEMTLGRDMVVVAGGGPGLPCLPAGGPAVGTAALGAPVFADLLPAGMKFVAGFRIDLRGSPPGPLSPWPVETPPGWPVPQALRRSSASAPRTSPTGMRSGRRRSDERTRSESEATPSLVRSATRFGAAHCSSRVSSISTTRSDVFDTSASNAFVSVVLPVEVPPATRMFRRSATARRKIAA
nr:helix-turn-helix transcriptional regulator [uncultured Gordonia sp.]